MSTTEIIEGNSEERNCAFQYATIQGKILCDETGLTLDEAKELFNKHYDDAAKRIYNGGQIQMAIWHNMPDEDSYGDKFVFIDNDAKSDGKTIWEDNPRYYTKFKDVKHS